MQERVSRTRLESFLLSLPASDGDSNGTDKQGRLRHLYLAGLAIEK